MALINAAEVTRFPIPHEPGAWVELRRLSGGQLRKLGVRTFAESTDRVIAALGQAISGWSYDVPVSTETVELLDGQTLGWLIDLSARHTAGELTDDEKKERDLALHRLLNGAREVDTDVVTRWLISRLCEEFPGRGPGQVRQELEHDPDRLMLEILDMRAYARTKAVVDPLPAENAPSGPMVDRVKASVAELLRRAVAARQNGDAT